MARRPIISIRKVTALGKSTGISMPDSALFSLDVQQGDKVQVIVEDGRVIIEPINEDQQKAEAEKNRQN